MAVERDVVEETFENTPTGVEVELDEEQPEEPKPWDPEKVRVSTRQYSLRNILDMIDDGDVELAPDFQRNEVWTPRQRSRLIESIILEIPLPAFYFADDKNGVKKVVDGLQRLSTVRAFVRLKAFPLKGLEYLSGSEGKKFDELLPVIRRRINGAQITAHIIDPTTPSNVVYDIFKRINTGGSPLNAQEIRHCMSQPRSREFLKRCAESEEFLLATANSMNKIRMHDREVVLRYCAFRLFGIEGKGGYASYKTLDAFLESMTDLLDDERGLPDDQLESLYDEFRSVMLKSHLIFGDQSFRKWPKEDPEKVTPGRRPINRPLFEAWSVVLSNFDESDLRIRKGSIVEAARELMTTRREYDDAITSGTGNIAKVKLRFGLTEEAARAGV